MIAVITGDIIGSAKADTASWLKALKDQLNRFGTTPKDWEIYRGDEFQLEIEQPEEALLKAFQIKSCIKAFKSLDARMAIGIGEKSYQGGSVSQSTGTAFISSGRQFDSLKKQKVTMAINSPENEFDQEINLMLKLAMTTMDKWSVVSAKLAELVFEDPDLLQEEIAKRLKIKQAAVSQRSRRANLDLMLELEGYYRYKLKKTIKT